jgi:hypothetical protein
MTTLDSPIEILDCFMGLLSRGTHDRNDFSCRSSTHALSRSATFCKRDGFRMTELATRTTAAGPAFESRQEGNRERMGTPISRPYGIFAVADATAQVLERGAHVGEKGLRGDFEARARKGACGIVAGRNQQ